MLKNSSEFHRTLSFIGVLLLLFSCNGNRELELVTTPTGLRYHFFHIEKTGKTGNVGDIYALHLQLKNNGDSLILDRQLLFERNRPVYPGDFHEALSYLHVGDSALFVLAADSFFYHHGMPMPSGVKMGEDIKLYLGCQRIMNPIENAIYMNEEELQRMNSFIERKGWNVTTDSSGIKWERVKASVPEGAQIIPGDTVAISYLYYTLNEKIIQQSKAGDYWRFEVGDSNRIIGLSKVLTFMRSGEKVRAIIPYSLAFGENGLPPLIAPFTTIILEIEVHEVRKP